MKNIKDYNKLNYRMVFEFEPEDGVYIVKFPELPGCIAHGETPQKALKEAVVVKNEWLQVALESEWDIPVPEKPSEASGRITLRPPKYLHEKIITRSKLEGTSINQLLISFIAEGLEKKKSDEMVETLKDQCRAFGKLAGMVRVHHNEDTFSHGDAWAFSSHSAGSSKTQNRIQCKVSEKLKEQGMAHIMKMSQGVK